MMDASLLDATTDLEERERKFLLDANSARAFWAIASHQLRPAGAAASPYTHVRTTYFDTPTLTYYRSCRGAIARRLRVREYAQAAGPGATPVPEALCFLELKQSSSGRRAKTRVAMRPDEVYDRLAALSEGPFAPCVTTWCQRTALVDAAAGIRITLDQQLLLCRPALGRSFDYLDPDDVLMRGPSFILELKTPDALPAWLAAALTSVSEAVGFSKFMLGMSALESTAGRRSERSEHAGCAERAA